MCEQDKRKTRPRHAWAAAAATVLVCASPVAASAPGNIQPIRPFAGDASENFESFSFGEIGFLPVFDTGTGPNGTAGFIFITTFSSFMGSTVFPHTGVLFAHATNPVDFVFFTPVSQFGGYMATNSGTSGGTVEFYDAADQLIGTAPLDVTFMPGAAPYTWNGWSSSTPLGRVRVVGAGILEGFLGFDDMEISFAPSVTPALDIKPGSCPNSFNRNSNGVLPVALIGTESFDVGQVDLSSLELSRTDGEGGSVSPHEGPPGPHSVFADVATPFSGELCDCHELDGDGILDLSMKFKSNEVVSALDLNSLPNGALVDLTLSGILLDGTPFAVNDCIRLVPLGTPPGLLSVGSNMPSVFVEVGPLDEQLDGGGFVSFERTYPLGTFVTLTAPSSYWGIPFAGWQVNDRNISVIGSPLVQSLSIDLFVLDDEQSVKAIYRNSEKYFDADGQQQQQLEN